MKSVSDTRKPYRGSKRSLVIAVDVGTTFSGVSYAILDPGQVPKIHGVTRFPGQEHVAGNSKIPTIMYYDKKGKVVAAGAEADNGSLLDKAEDEGWSKAELFKLRLRPKSMKLQMNGMRFSGIPKTKTAVDVFGDFLGYLFRCTRAFIEDTHANGVEMWRSIESGIQFVLSHPNGWEGAQQSKMRRAAIIGGLIPDTDEGKARIRFVTEGEASLHACVLNGLAADVLSNPSGHGFIVADAGGGTLDISSYSIRGTDPLVIEEIAPPDCIFAGSVFVSRRARAFLEGKLKGSKYGSADSLDHITKRFDETTKRLFRDKKDAQFIPFGSPLDKDLTVGIRGGQLKLSGSEVADLFEPSIDAAMVAIKNQIEGSKGTIKSVWLVGGFAASPWLFSQLQERLAPLGVNVSRPDSQTSKAVADGAVGFYADHHVSARMSKFMYGVEFLREFDASNPDHVKRQDRLCELPSGPKLLLDAFDCILARGVKVKESTVFSRKYCTELVSLSTLSVFEVEVWCARTARDEVPQWILRNSDEFSTLCMVRADLSPLTATAQPKTGPGGKTFYTIVFSIELHFGLTEFKARIKWTDNGETKYGPASIVYNEAGRRAEEHEPDNLDEDPLTTPSSRAKSLAPSRRNSDESVRSRAPSTTSQSVRSRAPSTAPSQAEPADVPPEVVVKAPSSSLSDLYESPPPTPKESRSRQPSMHGGSIHGGSIHGGSMHGGSIHGGSMHGGSDSSRRASRSVDPAPAASRPPSIAASTIQPPPPQAPSQAPSRAPSVASRVSSTHSAARPSLSRTASQHTEKSVAAASVSRAPSVAERSVHGGSTHGASTPVPRSRTASVAGDASPPPSSPPTAPAVTWSGSMSNTDKDMPGGFPSIISRSSSGNNRDVGLPPAAPGSVSWSGSMAGDKAASRAMSPVISRSGSTRSGAGIGDVLSAVWDGISKPMPTPKVQSNDWAKLSTAGTPPAQTPRSEPAAWGTSSSTTLLEDKAEDEAQERMRQVEERLAAEEAEREAERQAEAERVEAERKAAEEQAEAERKAKEEKAEAERKAKEEKAEVERKAREEEERKVAEKQAAEDKKAAKAKELADRKAEVERKTAERKAEQDKKAAEKKAELDKKAEERQRAEREKKEKAEQEKKAKEERQQKAKEEREQKDKEERERKEAEEKERQRKADEEKERLKAEEEKKKLEDAKEAEEKKKQDEARAAKEEEDRKAKEEAEQQAKEEAEKKAKEEAEKKAKEEAEKKAKGEAEQKAKEAQKAKAAAEAEYKAKEEAEKKAKEEAEKKAKEEADKKTKEEEKKAKDAAEKKAKEEAEQRAKDEAERKAKDEAEIKKAKEELAKSRTTSPSKSIGWGASARNSGSFKPLDDVVSGTNSPTGGNGGGGLLSGWGLSGWGKPKSTSGGLFDTVGGLFGGEKPATPQGWSSTSSTTQQGWGGDNSAPTQGWGADNSAAAGGWPDNAAAPGAWGEAAEPNAGNVDSLDDLDALLSAPAGGESGPAAGNAADLLNDLLDSATPAHGTSAANTPADEPAEDDLWGGMGKGKKKKGKKGLPGLPEPALAPVPAAETPDDSMDLLDDLDDLLSAPTAGEAMTASADDWGETAKGKKGKKGKGGSAAPVATGPIVVVESTASAMTQSSGPETGAGSGGNGKNKKNKKKK